MRTCDYHIIDGAMVPLDSQAPGYILRRAVCETSSFVWFSTMQIIALYDPEILEAQGNTEEPRCIRIKQLFQEAIELLNNQTDQFFNNVNDRWNQLALNITEVEYRNNTFV